MSDIGELNKQVSESEAYQTHIFLGELHTNHYVVVRNIQELQGFLAKCEDPDSLAQLWAYGKKERLDDAMSEVTRLLLNYLTSASARVESTRNMMRRRYGAQPFFKVYQNEVNRLFKGNALVEFVEGLRNYSVHYALPVVGGKWQFDQTSGMRHYFVLDKDYLLSSGFDWHKKGEAYLRQSGDEIIIREFTWGHFVRIHNFQVWLEQRLHTMHKGELDWLYAASAEIGAAVKKIYKNIGVQTDASP